MKPTQTLTSSRSCFSSLFWVTAEEIWPVQLVSLTLLGQLVVFGLLFHLLTPSFHARRFCPKKLEEPVSVSGTSRRDLDAVSVSAAVPGVQAGVGRRERGGIQRRIQSLCWKGRYPGRCGSVPNRLLLRGLLWLAGFGVIERLTVAVCRVVLRGCGILGLLQLGLRVLSRGHAVIPTQAAKASKRQFLTDASNVAHVNLTQTPSSEITCRGS